MSNFVRIAKSSFLRRKLLLLGSSTLAITTVISYMLGLLRDRLLAQQFGATSILDAYSAAFVIPDLLLNIFVAGALSAAFIPIFTELSSDEDLKNKTHSFISSVLNSSIFVILFFGTILFIFAPQLSNIIVPGFEDVTRHQYVGLLRILLVAPLIFAISNTFGSILVSKQKYLWFGLSAGLYNLGIILGIIFLAPKYGIHGVAVGALAGAVFHLASRMIGLAQYHIKYRISIKLDKHFKSFLRLMTPKMIGHPIEQITFFAYTIVASSLASGSIVILNLARNFQSAPVAIIGINLALASFPILANASAKNDKEKFVTEMRFAARLILLVTGIVAVGVYILREQIIQILLGGGAFDNEAVIATATALGFFTLAIPTESLNHLLARSFYSLKNSIIPVVVGILSLIIAIFSGYYFSRSMGVNGLVLGFVFGSYTKIILLSFFIRREVKTNF